VSARRVLYISPNAHLGGAEKACELFLKYHNRSRYIPAIAFLRDGPLVKQFKNLDVHTFLLPEVRLRDILHHRGLIKRLSQIIRSENAAIVHSTMAYGHFFGGRAAHRARVKNVWFQHGPVDPKLDKLVSLIRTDGILVNSKYTDSVQRQIMWRSFPTHVVYAGIDNPAAEGANAKAMGGLFRDKFKFPGDSIVCGSVGRIQEWKGQLEFLRAFHMAWQKNKNLRAVICGSSDIGNRTYEQQLKSFVKENSLEGIAVITGFLDELESAYRSFDILIHSSVIAEPFGLVPLEGMIRSVPVIACPWGGPSETVQDGKTGLLVDPRNTKSLADAILKLADDNDLRNRLGHAGREAAARFLAPRFVERVEAVYDGIMAT
jgi:glycosyltransferase involved in cell wall biosynthesis